MFKLHLCWILCFVELKESLNGVRAYKLNTVQSCKHLKECSRTAASPTHVIDGPLIPLSLNTVDKFNELVPFYTFFNGTMTLVNDFRTEPDHFWRRHHRKRDYSDWSNWSPCSEKCVTVRHRRCLRPKICGSNIETQSSYCFTEGSRCLGLVMNYKWSDSIHSNKGNEYVSMNFTCGVTVDSTTLPVLKTPRYLIKIMGGRVSEKLHWPWHAAVLNGYKELICGGTLIAPGWVITAAHCSRKKLYVLLKEYDLSINEGDEVEVRVERVIIHPRYNPNTIDNDIALLKLRTLDLEVNGGYYLQPACLPVFDFQRRKRRPTMCVVIGWGKERSRDSYGSQVLREARVPIVGQRTCRAAYRRYVITDNMLCAGYRDGRSDTCSGDSGGPLLCLMRGRWTVAGVTSFGDGCGRRGKYGIYASVANHVRWIASVVSSPAPHSSAPAAAAAASSSTSGVTGHRAAS